MVMYANEQLVSEINDAIISVYQNESMLGLFKGVDIGSIAVEDWYHKKIDDIPDAALTLAGFNPTVAKLNASLVSFKVFTAAESLVISEKEWAQFQMWGLDAKGVEMLGQKVAQMASTYLFTGFDKGIGGATPHSQDNNIFAAGSGTLASPSIISTATAGVWSTAANKAFDLALLTAQLVSKGYKLATTLVFYPKIAEQTMTKKISGATYETSAKEVLQSSGVMGVIAIPDEYCPTLAGAVPTNILFDLLAVDISQIEIGYSRTERSRVVDPIGTNRNHTAEAEVWFCPYMIPRPWSDGTSIVKGVSRISAIAP